MTSYFVKPTNPTAARTFERTALVRVEAVHALSPSAKEAKALEGLKARLDAVKTETGAEIKAAAIDGRSGSRVRSDGIPFSERDGSSPSMLAKSSSLALFYGVAKLTSSLTL